MPVSPAAKDRSPDARRRGRIVAVSPDDGSAIDLKNPALAALLSWLIPGLGQLYQGRRFKGGLFMGVILFTLVVGMWLGGGRSVYASWTPRALAPGRPLVARIDRWSFLCQAGIGIVALPALVQTSSLHGTAREPLLPGSFLAPPLVPRQVVSRRYAERLVQADPDIEPDDFVDRPPGRESRFDQVSLWHRRLGRWFDIGTLWTMLAGMLNLLVVYDAWAGPMVATGSPGKGTPSGDGGPEPVPGRGPAGGRESGADGRRPARERGT